MKNYLLFLTFTLLSVQLSAQNYNQEKTTLARFLTRMYNAEPFDGVRVVDDYDNSYLLSVLVLDRSKYKSESDMNRVASVKAMSQASRFFNGSNITSDLIIRTSEKSDGSADTELIETINERSVGYIKELELLITFKKPNTANEQVFIFYKKVDKK